MPLYLHVFDKSWESVKDMRMGPADMSQEEREATFRFQEQIRAAEDLHPFLDHITIVFYHGDGIRKGACSEGAHTEIWYKYEQVGQSVSGAHQGTYDHSVPLADISFDAALCRQEIKQGLLLNQAFRKGVADALRPLSAPFLSVREVAVLLPELNREIAPVQGGHRLILVFA